jgi:hypothetical protein
MRWTIPLPLGLLLAGCPNPTPTMVVDPTPACDDPTAAIMSVDMPAAHAIYDACLVGAPDDAELALGAGVTGMFLLQDDPSTAGLITSCGQDPVDSGRIFGSDGLLADYDELMAGTVTITTAEVGGAPVDLFPDDTIVQAYSSDWRVSVDVGDDLRFKRNLYVSVQDERWDPVAQEDVPVAQGDVLPIGVSGSTIRVDGVCGTDLCEWSGFQDGSTGTITVVEADWNGGPVELAFDVTLAEEEGGPSLRLVGSVRDTPFDDEALLDDFAALDAFDTSRCDTDDCHSSTESLTRLAEVCPDVTQDVLWTRGRELRDRLTTLAGHFETAGADPGVQFTFPADALPFLFADLTFNQADALMMASALRMQAAGLSMATSYDLIDPTITGAARLGTYTRGYVEFDDETGTETCIDATYWGIDEQVLNAELIANAGNLRADEELALARTHLTHAFEDLKAALQASPAQGFLDATDDRVTADEVIADIDVVLASLGGQDGALASVPAYQITLDAYFANPLSRASVAAGIGEDPLFLETGTCNDYVEGSDALADWLPMNNGVFPVTEDDLDEHGAPGWSTAYDDYDYDTDGLPRFTSGTIEALEAAYGEAYYDAP